MTDKKQDNLFSAALEVAKEHFDKAKDAPGIYNPAGYALYKAWRYADSKGKEKSSSEITNY